MSNVYCWSAQSTMRSYQLMAVNAYVPSYSFPYTKRCTVYTSIFMSMEYLWCANPKVNERRQKKKKQISLTCSSNFLCFLFTIQIKYSHIRRLRLFCVAHSNLNSKWSEKPMNSNRKNERRRNKNLAKLMKMYAQTLCCVYYAYIWIEIWKALRSNWSLAHFIAYATMA